MISLTGSALYLLRVWPVSRGPGATVTSRDKISAISGGPGALESLLAHELAAEAPDSSVQLTKAGRDLRKYLNLRIKDRVYKAEDE